jgi:hypothetical protein
MREIAEGADSPTQQGGVGIGKGTGVGAARHGGARGGAYNNYDPLAPTVGSDPDAMPAKAKDELLIRNGRQAGPPSHYNNNNYYVYADGAYPAGTPPPGGGYYNDGNVEGGVAAIYGEGGEGGEGYGEGYGDYGGAMRGPGGAGGLEGYPEGYDPGQWAERPPSDEPYIRALHSRENEMRK